MPHTPDTTIKFGAEAFGLGKGTCQCKRCLEWSKVRSVGDGVMAKTKSEGAGHCLLLLVARYNGKGVSVVPCLCMFVFMSRHMVYDNSHHSAAGHLQGQRRFGNESAHIFEGNTVRATKCSSLAIWPIDDVGYQICLGCLRQPSLNLVPHGHFHAGKGPQNRPISVSLHNDVWPCTSLCPNFQRRVAVGWQNVGTVALCRHSAQSSRNPAS